MLGHVPRCPLASLAAEGCPMCAAIELAVGDERARYGDTWRANLRAVEERNYREGYADAAAGHAPRVDLIGPRI